MGYAQTLLDETVHAITEYAEKTPARVDWVGSRDGAYAIEWDEFANISRFRYDSSYGSQEVAPDLVVVFTDGSWLERFEYDGSEYWEYKHVPRRATSPKKFSNIKVEYYERSLAALNKESPDA